MRKLKAGILLLAIILIFAIAPKAHAEGLTNAYNEDGILLPGLPDWYPERLADFKFFHDEDAPRVVDKADIFTDEEERRMEARILELRTELQRDIVVFTDNSTYGLERSIYCADFYDFNGYGYGEGREGFCLLISMEPGNRGFWTAGTGPDTMGLHTYSAQQALDDALYEYVSNGQYGKGVEDWIENIACVYKKGFPFAPDWFPDRDGHKYAQDEAPKVLDMINVFTAEQEATLTAKIKELTAKYGMDIAILVRDDMVGISDYNVGKLVWNAYGYGYGEEHKGIILDLRRLSFGSERSFPYINTMGCYIPWIAEDRMTENANDADSARGIYAGAQRFLKDLEHYFKTGRVTKSFREWGKNAGVSLVIGAFIGWIALLIAGGKMKTVRKRYDADAYFVAESLRVDPLADDYLGTTTTRTYSPRESSSSGGSGGGSYSGSSGASHSGSGRSF